ncbi:MAG: hypothetical protein M1270_05805 [Gammaproteobacteria bacterium]|nr:hypothetical protein [Gammaproteobacteria bacterium]
MIGLVLPLLIIFLVFYTWLSVKVVRSAVKHSKEAGGNHVLAGWVAGIIMYSLVLWDFIPTHAMHNYYCVTQSGFTLNKSLDQWKLENPGVSETLTPITKGNRKKTGNLTQIQLNQRFIWEYESIMHPLKINEINNRIVDIQTGEILARYVNFDTSVGNPVVRSDSIRDFKWWIKVDSCERYGKKDDRGKFSKFMTLIMYQYQKEYRK